MAARILGYLFTPDVIVVFDPIINNWYVVVNPLNAELNPIRHLLALLGGATIVVVSRLRVNVLRSYFFKPILRRTNAKDDDVWTSHSVVAEYWSFWDVMPYRLVNIYRRFEGSQQCFYLQGQTQKTKTLCSFETPLNVHPSTHHNMTEDLNILRHQV